MILFRRSLTASGDVMLSRRIGAIPQRLSDNPVVRSEDGHAVHQSAGLCRRRSGQLNGRVPAGSTDDLSWTIGGRRFNHHTQCFADELRVIALAQPNLDFRQLLASRRFDLLGDLPWHVGGWRASPRAERKDVYLREAYFPHDAAGGFEVVAGFAWKTDDDIGGKRRSI
jgi:hypothetical protein